MERSIKIFGPTLQLFNRSPQALHRRSFTFHNITSPTSKINVPKSSPSLKTKPRAISVDYDRLKMAFSLGGGNFGGPAQSTGNQNAQIGPELHEIQTQV